MAKEKVTLTLDADRLGRLRAAVGGRSLSAAMDVALAAHLDHVEHLAAVDEWLAEMDAEHGPVSDDALRWAADQIDAWEATRRGTRRAS